MRQNEYEKYFLSTYRRKRFAILKNEGCRVFTDEGVFLDLVSGLGVNVLGGLNTGVIEAIKDQIEKYLHVSNYFVPEPVGEMAKYLVENTFASKVFFTNSGTESIETGLKMMNKYGKKCHKSKIVVCKGGFHGRSMGAVSVTAQKKYQDQVDAVVDNVVAIDFNDIEAAEATIDESCVGIIMEVIQGEGGVNIASKEFVLKVRELSEKYGALLLFDEIQTGMGRTGKLFAFEHYGIEPDMVAASKALGGGLPLGVLMVNDKLTDIFKPGDHGSTFGGNPLSCCAGLALLEQVNNDEFYQQVLDKSAYLKEKLEELKQKNGAYIGSIKIAGLMIGIEILQNPETIVEQFEDEKIFVNVTQKNILRLLPPLVLTKEDIDQFITVFEKIISKK